MKHEPANSISLGFSEGLWRRVSLRGVEDAAEGGLQENPSKEGGALLRFRVVAVVVIVPSSSYTGEQKHKRYATSPGIKGWSV